MARKRDKLDQLYSRKRWRAVRQLVLNRDHYTCQVCKRKGKLAVYGNIVHHIVELREDESLAYEVDNLETVCTACHNTLHPERSSKRLKTQKKKQKHVIKFKSNQELE